MRHWGDVMTNENFKTFKNHVATVLNLRPKQVDAQWRKLRGSGVVKTERGHLGAHTPTDVSILRFLRAVAITNLGNPAPGRHRITHNHIDNYEDAGVIVEKHNGVFMRVEIAPNIVRSILNFGR